MSGFTAGPWEARKVPSAGLQIYARIPLGPDEAGQKVQRIYDVLPRPIDLKVLDGGVVRGMIAYERWVQFPTVDWERAQEANAHLIAAAPDLFAAAKVALTCLTIVNDSGEFDWTDEADALAEAIAKATAENATNDV